MRPNLHIVLVVLLVAAGLFYFAGEQRESAYREISSRYLSDALADISRWQPDALRRHLAPEAQAALTEQQLAALLERYRPLGAFRRLESLELQRLSMLSGWMGGPRLLGYSGEARFTNGAAQFTATLKEDEDGTFSLYNLNFSDPQAATTTGAN